MDALNNIVSELEERRRQLQMPHRFVARRSGLSLRTVQRALSGKGDVRFENLSAIAKTLGADLGIVRPRRTSAMRTAQARVKAEEIIRATQGSAALEGLAVGEETANRVRRQIQHRLCAGSSGRLWS